MVSIVQDGLTPDLTQEMVVKHPITGEPTSVILYVKYPSRKLLKNVGKALRECPEGEEGKAYAIMIDGWKDNGAIDEPYSQQACAELLSDERYDFILNQLDEMLVKAGDFFKKK